MDKAFIRKTCSDRLDSWSQLLVKDHATPALLLGIGHDHKSGSLFICTVQDMAKQDIEKLLRIALERLDEM